MKKIALVTVLYESDHVLSDFLKSLAAQTFTNYHLYIIDNSPNTTTERVIKEQLTDISYTHIKNGKNVGVARGNNQGIIESTKSKCKYTLLLNNDITFENPELLSSIVDYADKHEENLIVPKIKHSQSKKIWMAGGRIVEWKGIVVHEGQGKPDLSRYNIPGYVNYAPTCFILINNIVFKHVGLMDEGYFVYYDDVDFVYRCNKQGYRIFYKPDLTIFHNVGNSSGGSESLFTIYYNNRNRIYFIRKNLSGLIGGIALLYSYSRFVKFLFKGKKKFLQLRRAVKDGMSLPINRDSDDLLLVS